MSDELNQPGSFQQNNICRRQVYEKKVEYILFNEKMNIFLFPLASVCLKLLLSL